MALALLSSHWKLNQSCSGTNKETESNDIQICFFSKNNQSAGENPWEAYHSTQGTHLGSCLSPIRGLKKPMTCALSETFGSRLTRVYMN